MSRVETENTVHDQGLSVKYYGSAVYSIFAQLERNEEKLDKMPKSRCAKFVETDLGAFEAVIAANLSFNTRPQSVLNLFF